VKGQEQKEWRHAVREGHGALLEQCYGPRQLRGTNDDEKQKEKLENRANRKVALE